MESMNFFKGQLKFFVLKSLNEKPMHGYLLMKKISECCMNLWKPTAGALYPTLKELRKEKLIIIKSEAKTGRRKKIYTITRAGCKKLEEMQKHISMIEENFVKFSKDAELSKYSIHDIGFLFSLLQNALQGEGQKFKGTLLEFAMLAKQGKFNRKNLEKAKNNFLEFLQKIEKINNSIKNKQQV